MRYAVIVVLETELQPEKLRDELVSVLEFDHEATTHSVVVLTDDGKEAAVCDREEGT